MMRPGPVGEGGFSLIETLVAMVLTGVTLMALGPVMFQAAHRQVIEAGTVERNSALLGESTRLSSIPVADLAGQAGCRTLPAVAQAAQNVCVTMQPMGGGQTQITVVVSPAGSSVAPDSVVLIRKTSGQGNPFDTGGSP